MYFAYANPVGIGQNIFGKTEYLKKFFRSGQDINDKGFFIATNGEFSLLVPRKCLKYKTSINIKNCENKGLAKTYFDRFYLQQGTNKFYFTVFSKKKLFATLEMVTLHIVISRIEINYFWHICILMNIV